MTNESTLQTILTAQTALTRELLTPAPARNPQKIRKLTSLVRKPLLRLAYAGWGLDQELNFQLSEERMIRVRNLSESDLVSGRIPADLDILVLNHNFAYKEEARSLLSELTQNSGRDVLTIMWFIDHHHMHKFCLDYAGLCDFYLLSHLVGIDYLYASARNLLGTLFCPIMQWNTSNIDKLTKTYLYKARSEALYGGFHVYGHPREEFARRIQQEVDPNNIFLRTLQESQSTGFFSMGADERFADWCSHKTSVVLPVRNDIPIRIFDALLTGQIPIISDAVVGLEFAISIEDQLNLPVFRFREGDVANVRSVYEKAVQAFNAEGNIGVKRRNEYALVNHTIPARMKTVSNLLEAQFRSL